MMIWFLSFASCNLTSYEEFWPDEQKYPLIESVEPNILEHESGGPRGISQRFSIARRSDSNRWIEKCDHSRIFRFRSSYRNPTIDWWR